MLDQSADPRETAFRSVHALLRAPESELAATAGAALSPDCDWRVSAPVGDLIGPEAVVGGWILPLRRALGHVRRRDEIFVGGVNRRSEGGHWAAAVTHYVGTHAAEAWGVPPSGRLAFFRAGEFYRIDGGRITKARLIVDFVDLMRQGGRMPLPSILGTEMLFPGPATHDGVLPATRDGGDASLDLIDAMIADLHVYDSDSFGSEGQTGQGGHWHDDMLWYGPGGIGSTYRWRGFVDDHRRAFLEAFPDRKGGNHYCRIGDGAYAAISGWPSMTMTHRGDYLGVPATGRSLTLRVMDFYRCADAQIIENWVCLDYIDLFQQMGVDLIAQGQAMTVGQDPNG